MLTCLGFEIHQGLFDRPAQEDLLQKVRAIASVAPMRAYQTPGGRRMSVRMTAAGDLGWVSDHRGYRYDPVPEGGRGWPEIPDVLLDLWRDLVGGSVLPQSCLVNFYGEGARMGLHRDDTEGDIDHPVLSVSLGDDALFRMGGLERKDPTRSHWLSSGDVVLFGGAARLAYHGVDRIKFGSSTLLPKGGRINLTLRVVAGTG